MRLLVVSDDKLACDRLVSLASAQGFDPDSIRLSEVRSVIVSTLDVRPELVVVHLCRAQGDESTTPAGIETIRHFRRVWPTCSIIVVGNFMEAKEVLRVLREGADEVAELQGMDQELPSVLERQRIRQAPVFQGRVFALMGANGGVGTSTIAASLAAALVKKRPATEGICLVDGCVHGDQATLWNLNPTHTLGDVGTIYDRLDVRMLNKCEARHAIGVKLLAAPPQFQGGEGIQAEAFHRIIQVCREAYDFTVLDMDRFRIARCGKALASVDQLLLVIRMDIVSVCNVVKLLSFLQDESFAPSRIAIVANRNRQPHELTTKQVEDAIGVTIQHFVPDDPATVNASNNLGTPVVTAKPSSKIAVAICNIAASLEGPTSSITNNGAKRRFGSIAAM